MMGQGAGNPMNPMREQAQAHAQEIPSRVLEAERLQALHRTALLDTPPEPEFDRLTRLAADILRAPVALVTLLDADRQFFKSQVGLPEPLASQRETPVWRALTHEVATGEPLVVADARLDP